MAASGRKKPAAAGVRRAAAVVDTLTGELFDGNVAPSVSSTTAPPPCRPVRRRHPPPAVAAELAMTIRCRSPSSPSAAISSMR